MTASCSTSMARQRSARGASVVAALFIAGTMAIGAGCAQSVGFTVSPPVSVALGRDEVADVATEWASAQHPPWQVWAAGSSFPVSFFTSQVPSGRVWCKPVPPAGYEGCFFEVRADYQSPDSSLVTAYIGLKGPTSGQSVAQMHADARALGEPWLAAVLAECAAGAGPQPGETSGERRCRSCDAALPAEARFCEACGAGVGRR